MPSHLRPRPGTASAVGRLPIGPIRTSSRLAMQLRSIVDRRENELASHAKWPILGEKMQTWAKNATLAEKPGFPALFLGVSRERGGGFGKIFSGWQIILLRHTGDFQKTVLIGHSGDPRGRRGGGRPYIHIPTRTFPTSDTHQAVPRQCQPCMHGCRARAGANAGLHGRMPGVRALALLAEAGRCDSVRILTGRWAVMATIRCPIGCAVSSQTW